MRIASGYKLYSEVPGDSADDNYSPSNNKSISSLQLCSGTES